MSLPSSPFRGLVLASLATFFVLFALSCDEEEYSPPLAVCTPVRDALSPTQGPLSGGTEVALHGLFIATELGVRDTRFQLDGAEAEVVSVSRGEGCLACDQCILTALRCAECERVCRGENGWNDIDSGEWILPDLCEEQVNFITPAATDPGPAALILTTSRGSGVGLDFVYTAGGVDDDSAL